MTPDSLLQRHPRWSATLVLALTIALTLGTLELAARWLVSYDVGYYSARRNVRGELIYTYGKIKINELGFPDDEFNLEDQRPRIGYVGDSVTFGVGAGYGYRITEILEKYYPAMQHMNMSGGLGQGVTAKTIEEVLNLTERFRLSTVVYLLNLNDISPGSVGLPEKDRHTTSLVKSLEAKVDFLRGRSYLYTWARNATKTFLLVHGFGVQGVSYELYPERYERVIRETANRVNYLDRALRRLGAELVVVVLPYEMQISQEAERIYREYGIQWGDGFIEGLTQRKLIEHLRGVRVFDATEAFVSRNGYGSDREANRLGQYFVYDRGGRLDWNHPERAGHRRIAEYLVQSAIFGRPEGFLAKLHREPTLDRP